MMNFELYEKNVFIFTLYQPYKNVTFSYFRFHLYNLVILLFRNLSYDVKYI